MMILQEYRHMSFEDAKQWRGTYKALKDLEEMVNKRVIIDFNSACQFIAGYTRGEFVSFDAIVQQLNEWVRVGLIKPYDPMC